MTTNPVADAEALMDCLSDSAARAREAFAEDTRKAFEDAYKGQHTMVEWVKYAGGQRICLMPTRDALYEELDSMGPQFAFWRVLAESKCPLVAELKKAVADSYIERWADEVAEMRAGS